jgi:hypothetical protein
LLFERTASRRHSRERLRSSAVPFSTVMGIRLASDQRCDTSFDSHPNVAPKSKFHKTSCPVACGMSRWGDQPTGVFAGLSQRPST